MSEDCPAVREFSNLTIENQKEQTDDTKNNLPSNVLIGNNELMKIRGLKMSSLGKKMAK